MPKLNPSFLRYATHPALLFVLIVRVGQALTLPWFPVSGYLVAQLLDVADYHFMRYFTRMQPEAYQLWDKLMDSIFTLMMAMLGYFFTDVGNWFLAALLYRGLGQTLFTLTKHRWLMPLFPNFVEVLYLWKIFLPLVVPSWFISTQNNWLILGVLIAVKLGQEILLHLWWEKHWTPTFTKWRQAWGWRY